MNVSTLGKTTKAMTWLAPALLIPTMRYFKDNNLERRKLFVRDISTYTVGAAVFLITAYFAKKGLTAARVFSGEAQREFAAFLMALAANIFYAGTIPLKLSQHYAKKHPAPVEAVSGLMVSRKADENQFLDSQRANIHFAKWSPPATVGGYNPWAPVSITPMRPYGLNTHA